MSGRKQVVTERLREAVIIVPGFHHGAIRRNVLMALLYMIAVATIGNLLLALI